jgi:DNA repair exonuclease SbcCD ATPase subunit
VAETIRDVVIRISLKQQEARLQVPDVAPLEQAFEQAQDSAAKQMEAVEGHTKDVEEALESAGDAAESFGDQASESFDTVEGAAESAQKAAEEIGDAGVEAADGFVSAGEGALKAARGIALFATDSEEDLRAVIERVAMFQGAIDVLGGSFEVFKNMRDGLKAVRAAGGLAAISQTAVAAANTAVTVTATAATAAMRSLTAALGPVGIAVVAVTVAATALAAAWAFFSDGDAEKSVDRTTDAMGGLHKSVEDTLTSAEQLKLAFDLSDVLQSTSQQQQQLLAQQQKLAGNVDFSKQIEFVEAQLAEAKKSFLEFSEETIVNRAAFALSLDQLEEMQKRGATVRDLLLAINKANANIPTTRILVELNEQDIQAAEQKLDILGKQEDALERQVQQEKESLRTAEKRLEAEQQRLRSLDEIVGRLSKVERQELESLIQRVERGDKLTPQLLRRLEGLAGGAEAVDKLVSVGFAEIGRQAGIGLEGVKKRAEEVAESRQAQDQRTDQLRQEVRQAREDARQEIEQFEELLDVNRDTQLKVTERLRDLVSQQEEFQAQLKELEIREEAGNLTP